MASILALKRRIVAAQNVSKTTRAMQMIAASKMKRAQHAALSSRPYVQKLSTLASTLALASNKAKKHPFLTQRFDTKKTLVIVISPDKGLCGGLITNLLREFLKYSQNDTGTSYVTVGRKLESRVTHRNNDVIASFVFGNATPTLDMVYPIIRIIEEYFTGGKVDSVKILGTHFISIFSQTPKITTILPLTIASEQVSKQFYVLEPNIDELLSPLLKHYLEMGVFQHMLESFVSEQAARMIAMQNATDNANDIIGDLKLEYNKTRQAKITSEILDITGASMGSATVQ